MTPVKMYSPELSREALLPEWIEALREYAATDDWIVAIWLFGSRTKGTHRANSDLDVALVTRTFHESWQFRDDASKARLETFLLAKRFFIKIHICVAHEGDMVIWPCAYVANHCIYTVPVAADVMELPMTREQHTALHALAQRPRHYYGD